MHPNPPPPPPQNELKRVFATCTPSSPGSPCLEHATKPRLDLNLELQILNPEHSESSVLNGRGMANYVARVHNGSTCNLKEDDSGMAFLNYLAGHKRNLGIVKSHARGSTKAIQNEADSNSHKDISRITSLHPECLREQRKYNHAKNCGHSHTATGLLCLAHLTKTLAELRIRLRSGLRCCVLLTPRRARTHVPNCSHSFLHGRLCTVSRKDAFNRR